MVHAGEVCSRTMESTWLVHGRPMTGMCLPLPHPVQRSQATILAFRWFGLTLNSPKSQRADMAFPLTVVMCFLKGLCVSERTVLSRIPKDTQHLQLTPSPSTLNLVTYTDEVLSALYPVDLYQVLHVAASLNFPLWLLPSQLPLQPSLQ